MGGGFWVLARRHGEELGADEAWRGLLQRFPKLLDIHPDVEQIGTILGQRAVELDSFVGSRGTTRIHGDAKGWNFFFESEEKAASPFLFIDMQWTGSGHPLQDVAYALTTTLEEESLSKMDSLVDFYLTNLGQKLTEKGINLDVAQMREEYDKVIVSALWKRLDPESIVKNKDKVGPSMINRSYAHVKFITERLSHLLLSSCQA